MNAVEPFVSSEDVRKGSRWSQEIAVKLSETQFGIICLTPDNLKEPWILFEAGALSKSIKGSLTWTLLIGKLQPTDIEWPLASFQHTKLEKEDFKKLVQAINAELGTAGLNETVLEKIFQKWWGDLEQKVQAAIIPTPSHTPKSDERNPQDLLREILELTRYIARNTDVEVRVRESEEQRKLRTILSFAVSDLQLPERISVILTHANIKNVAQLASKTEEEMLKYRGINAKSLFQIKDTLAALGLCLGMKFDPELLSPFDGIRSPTPEWLK